MKKIVIFGCIAVVAIMLLSFGSFIENETDKYLRIHIRAASDSSEEQGVKYLVRDAVINYLAPFLAQENDKQGAMNMVQSKLPQIKTVVDGVLTQNGQNYSSKVYLSREVFPTRQYEEYTLERGIYDSLIIELGEGTGQNWWCVVYPPLCFVAYENTDSTNIQYRSFFREMIEKFFKS